MSRYRVFSLVVCLLLIGRMITPGTLAQAQQNPAPIFFGDNKDNLPTYICAADAFASYYTLQQIQVQGLDVKNRFKLGIVPFLLDNSGGKYDINEDRRAELLSKGDWDCLLTTLDSVSLKGSGVITAIVDESAGADQIWGRGIKTLNDLKGKKISFVEGSVSQFMVLYALAVAGLRPERDVTLVASDSVESAVKAFETKQADAVSGWEPDILAAEKAGGQRIIASDKLRVAIDVVVTSRNAVSKRADLAQAFHRAWFDALRGQADSFDDAAAALVKWGHNDWTGLKGNEASKSWRDSLTLIAQATLAQNIAIMKDPAAVLLRIDAARRVWSIAGVKASTDRASTLVEPKFVLALESDSSLVPKGKPVNDSFLMGSRPKIDTGNAQTAQTLAVLPCRRFDFLPDSAILTRESKRILDQCVVPLMQSTAGTYLKVVGSSAWPGPTGSFTEQDIRDFALARAVAVREYLTSRGIDTSRFITEILLPPQERRNSTDEDVQAQDRYVELTLLESGR